MALTDATTGSIVRVGIVAVGHALPGAIIGVIFDWCEGTQLRASSRDVLAVIGSRA